MPTPILTGDRQGQGYIKARYEQLHKMGYSKSEAHSIAFNEFREMMNQPQEEPQPDPYNDVVYSTEPGF